MRLHEDKERFRELIEYSAEYFGYNESKIEKDYWISTILKELSENEFEGNVFFKGGTSLSKAYHIIDRFSEDLDLFVYTGNVASSITKEKTLNRNVYKFITDKHHDIFNADLSQSGGRFRKAVINYEQLFSDIQLKKNLEVEIKSCDLKDKSIMFYPSDRKTIQSLIGTYLDKMGKGELTKEYGQEAFQFNCLNPRKTICDKISRLTRLSYSDNPIDKISAHIRDVYDLHKIIQNEEYTSFVHSKYFLDGMYSVCVEDISDDMARTHLSLANALLFSNPSRVLEADAVKTAYNDNLASLLFKIDDLPKIDDIKLSMSVFHKRLRQFDEYREAKIKESRNRLSNVELSTNGVNGLEYPIIRCCIDNIQQNWKKTSSDDAKLIRQGLLPKDVAALKWFREELDDNNLSYHKDASLVNNEYVISIAVRLTKARYPDKELSEEEHKNIRNYFSQFNSREEKDKAILEIWDEAEKLPETNKNGNWLKDAKDYLEQLAELKEDLSLNNGMKR